MLIAFIMITKDNINVPKANAITSFCDVSDKPFAEGTLYFSQMKTKRSKCEEIKTGINSTHGMSRTRLYRLWSDMKTRCYNQNSITYHHYGGRGIKICDEWRFNFLSYYNWAINNGYQKNLTIDRIDNFSDYSPLNCRWVSRSINSQNTRLLRSSNTSGYRGVYYIKERNRWLSLITDKRKRHHLGYYLNAEIAAQAYNNYILINKTNHPLNLLKHEQHTG